MPEEPTLGEVARRLEAVHQDLKEDLRDVAARLDGKVSMEVYRLEQRSQERVNAQLAERIAALEEQRRQEAEQIEARHRATEAQRASDRRLVFTALVAPVLLILLQVYLTARGAGS